MAKKRTVDTIRLPTKRTTAKYHRYSTLGQDDDSIERQEGITEEYRAGKRMVEGPSFNDKAQSAYTGDRPQFQALLRFCEANYGTDLIIENISRLVRDGFPYTEIIRLRKMFGLRVHSVMDGGLLDETREAELVAKYTKDHRIISYYTRAGILTKARKGKWITRVPWGCYKDSHDILHYLPGYKEHVQNLFAMAVGERLGAPEIAKRMTAARAISPNGTIEWNASAVKMILKRKMYTGHVRIARLKADWELSMYENEAEASNPYYADFELVMPQLEAISVEDWEAAQPFRHRKRMTASALQSHVTCPTCGGTLVSYQYGDTPVLKCRSDECPAPVRYRIVPLEAALFDALHILSDRVRSEEAFRKSVEAECNSLDAWVVDRRRELDKDIAKLHINVEQGRARLPLIDPILFDGFQADLVKWQTELNEMESVRAALPGQSATNLLDSADIGGFTEAMQEYGEYLPLIPDDGPRARMYSLVKDKLVEKVIIAPNPEGGHDLTFHIRVLLHGKDFSRAIVREVTIPGRAVLPAYAGKQDCTERLMVKVATSEIVITDGEAKLLSGVIGLGDLSKELERNALNIILTAGATDGEVGLYSAAKHFGGGQKLYNRARYLRNKIDHEAIEQRLSAHRGVPVRSLRPEGMGVRSHAAKLALRHHPILMIKLAREGGFHAKLTDEQFTAIEPFLPKEYKVRRWRDQLNALFYALRIGATLRGSGLMTKETEKKLYTLTRGNRLTDIVRALLRLEGWDLPSGYLVETLRCDGTADRLVDMDVQRLEIAKSLVNVGGAMPPRPKRTHFVRLDTVEVDPIAGLVRNEAGIVRGFIPIEPIIAMFARPGEWAPWPEEDKLRVRSRFALFYGVLKKLGWQRGDSAIVQSHVRGLMLIPAGAEASGGRNPKMPSDTATKTARMTDRLAA